jgi:hypothetical protein
MSIHVERVDHTVYTISSMGPDWFWCREGALGIPTAEIAAFVAGELPEPRAEEIRTIMALARNGLRDVEVPGVQFWMTTKRAMS